VHIIFNEATKYTAHLWGINEATFYYASNWCPAFEI